MNKSGHWEGKEFSLVQGGPFFQLLNRIHLAGKALELVKLRTIIVSLFTWLPLFILSMIAGQAWGERITLPFIEDIEVHIRFLVVLPVFIVAELIVHDRLRVVVKEFELRKLIPEAAQAQFEQAITSALRLRNSIAVEAILLITTYVIGYNVVWQQSMALDTPAWFSEPALGKGHLSMAGIWFRYVSLPIFQFLFLRWYFRIFIWIRFLFQVSRIRLQLVATHPDNAGGLGFLANSVYAFMPLAVAHGALLSGMIANHIFHDGAALLDFKIEIAIIVLVMMFIVILPLFAFSAQLADAKRAGSLAYGELASRFVQDFEARWLLGKSSVSPLTGTHEIQGLADLSHAYKVVEGMQFVPITRNGLVMLAVAIVAPIVPLVFTMMPISELIKIISGIFF